MAREMLVAASAMAMVAGATCWSFPAASMGVKSLAVSPVASCHGLRAPELRKGGATVLSQQRRKGVSVKLSVDGPPMDKEPLDLTEENVQNALEEAKEVRPVCFMGGAVG
eukprot:566395-Hanusia_phi.AAC.1